MTHAARWGGRRWPVVDGIPFLRLGRERLADEALRALDAGDREAALGLLLADQDEWWTGDAPPEADLRGLAREAPGLARREAPGLARHEAPGRTRREAPGLARREAPGLTLREAMAALRWGRVADYFAHRWSDPTFVAGLALVGAHWTAPRDAFELACGIGHHLRELALRGVRVAGADVVFAKLWLARHFVAPAAELVCFDAGREWPALPRRDLVLCHDALYFLEPKEHVVGSLRARRGEGGLLLVSHVHNADWPNLSSGAALSAARLRELFPDALAYADEELTAALLGGRAPRPATDAELAGTEAFAVAEGPGLAPPLALSGGVALPPPGAELRRNPLYEGAEIRFPSDRYAAEYGPRAPYRPRTDAPERATLDDATAHWARRRELVHLPERW